MFTFDRMLNNLIVITMLLNKIGGVCTLFGKHIGNIYFTTRKRGTHVLCRLCSGPWGLNPQMELNSDTYLTIHALMFILSPRNILCFTGSWVTKEMIVQFPKRTNDREWKILTNWNVVKWKQTAKSQMHRRSARNSK